MSIPLGLSTASSHSSSYKMERFPAWAGYSGASSSSRTVMTSPDFTGKLVRWGIPLTRKASFHFSRLELHPVTGRTHQLRLHCAYLGCPILGDPQYGSPESMAFSQTLGLSSQLLCAKKITFPHPITGENITVTSKLDVRL